MKDIKQNSVKPSLAESWSETITDRFVPDPGLIPIGQTLSLVQRLSRNGSRGSLSRDLFQRYGKPGKTVTGHPGDMPYIMNNSTAHHSVQSSAEPIPIVQAKAMVASPREGRDAHQSSHGILSSKGPNTSGVSTSLPPGRTIGISSKAGQTAQGDTVGPAPISRPVRTVNPLQKILDRAVKVEKPHVGPPAFKPGSVRSAQGVRLSPPLVRGTIQRKPSDTAESQGPGHQVALPDRVASDVPVQSTGDRVLKATDTRPSFESIHEVVQGKNRTSNRLKTLNQPQGITDKAGAAPLILPKAESGRVLSSDLKAETVATQWVASSSITKPSIQRKMSPKWSLSESKADKTLNLQTGFPKAPVGSYSDVSAKNSGPVGTQTPVTPKQKTALGSTELPVQAVQKTPHPVTRNMGQDGLSGKTIMSTGHHGGSSKPSVPVSPKQKTVLNPTELPVQAVQKMPHPVTRNMGQDSLSRKTVMPTGHHGDSSMSSVPASSSVPVVQSERNSHSTMNRPALSAPVAFRPVVQAATALTTSETLPMGNISHPVSMQPKPKALNVSQMKQGVPLVNLKSESSSPMITQVNEPTPHGQQDMPLRFVRSVMPGGTTSSHPGPVVQRSAETTGSSSSQAPSSNSPEPSQAEMPALSPPPTPAQGAGQLSDLAEQVYALIMERLSMERESLGL